jgi:lambda repressor-like predicted transcriptional regulator
MYIMDTNKLPVKSRAQMFSMLCEGASMRSVSRLADVSINTVAKLLIDAGKFCAAFHDDNVRGISAKRIQCDEIWSFTYAKQKNVKTAIDAPE